MKQKVSRKFRSELKKWRENESRVQDILSKDQEKRRENANELDGFPTDAKVESDHKKQKKEKK